MFVHRNRMPWEFDPEVVYVIFRVYSRQGNSYVVYYQKETKQWVENKDEATRYSAYEVYDEAMALGAMREAVSA